MVKPAGLALGVALGLTAAMPADAGVGQRCNRDVEAATECRDMNPGTAIVLAGQSAAASQTTVQSRDAASGLATGKRSHKPLR